MKKLIIIIVILGVAGAGVWVWFKYFRAVKTEVSTTTTAKVEKGSLRLSVASTGRVVSNQDVDIKCKASGEIVTLPFDVSAAVKEGDLLVELDPVDEQRVLKQADVSLSASKAKLVIASQNLDISTRTLKTDHERAASALKIAQAQVLDSQAKADRKKVLLDKQLGTKEDWETAQTTVIQMQVNLEYAQTKLKELDTQLVALELQRQNVILAQAAVDSDNITRAIAADRLVDTKVMAPMDGVVTARNVQKGQIISSGISNVGGGTTVMTLSDLSHIFVVASVDESDIGKVEVGQPATITADAYVGMVFDGNVVQIAPRGVNVSNVVTYEVKIEVTGVQRGSRGGDAKPDAAGATPASGEAKPDAAGATPAVGAPAAKGPNDRPRGRSRDFRQLLKLEMTTNVEITTMKKDDILLVPVDAVTRKTGGKWTVSIPGADNTTQERSVVIDPAVTDGTKVMLVEGLTEGETVIYKKRVGDSRFSAGARGPGGPALLMGGGGRGR